MHGSQTQVGSSSDVRVNDLFGYIIYTEMIKELPTENSPVIHELSFTPRTVSAVQVVDDLMMAYIEAPVSEWGEILDGADVPDLRYSMCGVIGTSLTILF